MTKDEILYQAAGLLSTQVHTDKHPDYCVPIARVLQEAGLLREPDDGWKEAEVIAAWAASSRVSLDYALRWIRLPRRAHD